MQPHAVHRSQEVHETDPENLMCMQIHWNRRCRSWSSMIRSIDSPSMNWKLDVYIVRKTSYFVTIQSGIWNLSSQTIDQIISQLDFLSSTFFHSSYCTFCCCTISNDSRNILCTCTTFTFLCASMYKGPDLDTFTNIKEADSFRSINLVSTGSSAYQCCIHPHQSVPGQMPEPHLYGTGCHVLWQYAPISLIG